MPPVPRPPADEGSSGAIRVQLSLLSAQDSAAAQELAKSIGEISKMFEAMKASDFRDSAAKMAQLHAQMVADTERLQQQSRQVSRGGASTIDKVKQFVGLGGGTGVSDQDLAAAQVRSSSDRNKDAAASEEKARVEKERAKAEARRTEDFSDAQHRADQLRARANIPRIGTPEGDDPSAWFNRVGRYSGDEPSLELPRFGQLTVQDYLQLATRGAANRAAGSQPTGRISRGLDRIGLGVSPETAQRWAPQLERATGTVVTGSALMSGFSRVNQMLANQGFSFSGMDSSGAALGFRRDSNPFSDILGIQTPFSAAGQEGFRQSVDIQRLRMSAGINKEQAAQIVQASAQAGFSGGDRSNIARDFMAPLYRQFQVDPANLIPFTQVLRTGTASVGDLSRELSDLGEQARTARVDVNTMAQALSQAGEAAQSQGGSFMSGVQFGRQWTGATGLSPSVGVQLSQNPYSQAFLAASTGLPTFAQAAASPTAKIAANRDSLRMLYNAFLPALGSRGVRTPIRDAQNNIMGYDVGTNPALAAAANQAGINSDEASKILGGTDQQSRLSAVQSVLGGLETRARGIQVGGPAEAAARKWLSDNGLRPGPDGKIQRRQVQTAGGKGGGRDSVSWITDKEATKHYQEMTGQNALDVLSQKSGPGAIGFDDVIHAAHQAGIKGKELGDAMKGGTVEERIKKVQQLVSEKQAEAQADATIAFTGPAEKFFKSLVKKNGGWKQFGGEPVNTAATVSSPQPLDSTSNTGNLGGP